MGVATDDLVERYVAALAFFGERVADVRDSEWDLPTPNRDWDVRQVVAHVIVGEAQFSDVVAGKASRGGSQSASGDPETLATEVDASIVGTHPMSVWRGTALAAIDAARQPGVIDREFDRPTGPIPGTQLLTWRISENLVHGWDLAEAVGRPVPLDADLAELVLEFWLPVALDLAASGDYGPPTEPPAGAPAGERLLHLVGRR